MLVEFQLSRCKQLLSLRLTSTFVRDPGDSHAKSFLYEIPYFSAHNSKSILEYILGVECGGDCGAPWTAAGARSAVQRFSTGIS